VLADRVRGVAEARGASDADAPRGAPVDLAAAALSWADAVVSDPRSRNQPPDRRWRRPLAAHPTPTPVKEPLTTMTAATRTTPDLRPHDFLNIDALLDDEERMIRDTVRQFVRARVVPHVGDWFEAGTIPRELARDLGALNLLGMHLEGYGCAGASATAYGLACMELEAGDSGVRSLVSVQGSLAMYAIWRWGSEEQKSQWLPRMATGEAIGCFGLTEPDSGSDPGSMRTRARRDGDDWILNGSKMWITNGSIADVAIVWATTDDGVRGFLVERDTPGFTAPEIHKKLSLRASVTSELVLDDVRVPASAVLPEVESLKGPLSCLNEARYGIVWGAVGAARACFEAALDYAKERIQFGKPIASFQIQQQKLAHMAVEVNRATLLALHLGRMKDDGRLRPEHVSMGKLANVNAALDVARTARQVLGANGITLEYPVIRHMNNLESVVTYEGTADIHALVVGGALTGIQAFR
jgi:glutaryl-CoA dehydrogenase